MSGLIYHYTSGAGLKAIIENHCFWATDINFLNDSAEHTEGYQECIRAINDLISQTDGKHRETLIGFYDAILKTVEPNTLGRDTYVVSFAAEKDSIAHWFSYCEKNEGYCIGFEEAKFFDGVVKNKIDENFVRSFKNVIYGNVQTYRAELNRVLQSYIIIQNIENAISFLDKKRTILDEINFDAQQRQIIDTIFTEIIFSAGSYKLKGFEHELERRLILSSRKSRSDAGYSYHESGVNFRERRGVIYPYLAIDFSPSSVKEIVIGPSADFSIRKKGLESFLHRYNVRCEVTQSKTPLRFL